MVVVVVVVVVAVVVDVVEGVDVVGVVFEVDQSMDFKQLDLRIASQPLHVNAAAWTYT